ncbi:hypothetical protein ACFOOM_09980 [Streptomyces echinoruber]|uniref:zinc finger domain-containing protein n=1 Tax=Streptomyces echinoruber TaxID=68898 RepID=UPI0036100397
MTTRPHAAAPAVDDTPALRLPAITVDCPACGAPAGALCTSHSGTRQRRYDVHRARTAAHANAQH